MRLLYITYAFTEVAAIYPITPSSPMAEHTCVSARGRRTYSGAGESWSAVGAGAAGAVPAASGTSLPYRIRSLMILT